MDTTRFRERWPSTTRTSSATCTEGRPPIDSRNGESSGEAPEGAKVGLGETLGFELSDGTRHEFEVVALVEDPESSAVYGIGHRAGDDGLDEYVVTDEAGNLIEDQALADEIIREFEVFAEESAEGED